MVSQNCIRCILKGGGESPGSMCEILKVGQWDWAHFKCPCIGSDFLVSPRRVAVFFFHPLEAGFTRYGSWDTIPTSFLDCRNLSMHHGNSVKRQRNLRNWISSGLSNIDTVWLPLLFIIIIIIISKKEKITQAEHCLMGTDVNVSEWLSSDW